MSQATRAMARRRSLWWEEEEVLQVQALKAALIGMPTAREWRAACRHLQQYAKQGGAAKCVCSQNGGRLRQTASTDGWPAAAAVLCRYWASIGKCVTE